MHYYGLDVHKKSISFSCLDETGKVVRRGRIAPTAKEVRAMVAPSGGKAWVTLEATGAWSYVHDLVEPEVQRVVLAHPRRVKAISSARVKTDTVDAATLAHLLRTNLLPTAYVAPPLVRTWRELLRTRQGFVRMRTACRLRIQALLAKEGLLPVHADLFGRGGRQWLAAQRLTPAHQTLVGVLLTQQDALSQSIRTMEATIKEALGGHPIVMRLRTLSGFGLFTAAAFVAEVGDVSRFRRARFLISYIGLAPRVHASGAHVRLGKLTKEGPPLLRSYLAQAVQGAIRTPGQCQDLYQRVKARSGPQAARMAVARKLAIQAYHIWKGAAETISQG